MLRIRPTNLLAGLVAALGQGSCAMALGKSSRCLAFIHRPSMSGRMGSATTPPQRFPQPCERLMGAASEGDCDVDERDDDGDDDDDNDDDDEDDSLDGGRGGGDGAETEAAAEAEAKTEAEAKAEAEATA